MRWRNDIVHVRKGCGGVLPSRRAVTQTQAIIIAAVVLIATGTGSYIYLITSNPPSSSPSPSPSHSTTPNPPPLSPGETRGQSFIFGGHNRTYLLHVPKTYDADKPTPLLIALHGGGSTMYAMSIKGFTERSDKDGFIVVYPQGYDKTWNRGNEPDPAPQVDDVGFIRELVYRLGQRYRVDPDRVYATGHSAGAFMSHSLGAHLSDVFAAVAPVAGTIGYYSNQGAPRLYAIPEPSGPVSVIAFHGTDDVTIDYYGKRWSGDRLVLSVHDSVAFWVEHDGCSKVAHNTTSPDGSIIKSVYSGGEGGTEVVLYSLTGWGHDWPSPRINVTDMICDFLLNHTK